MIGVGEGLGGRVAVGSAVAVGAGLVDSGNGVWVIGTDVAVAGFSVGAAWETAVSWRTAVSLQPVERKRKKKQKISSKAAAALRGVIIH